MNISVLTLVVAALLSCGQKQASPASPTLYYSILTMQVNDEAAYTDYKRKVKKDFSALDGRIIKEFRVDGEPRGTIKFGKTNRVLLLAFASPAGSGKFQTDPTFSETRNLLSQAAINTKMIAGSSRNSVDERAGQVYVLKISNYKNSDGKAQKIAAQINARIQDLYDFRETLTITTNYIHGMSRADDVGIFYYTDARKQTELYKNSEIIQSIGKFNKTHLSDFVYLALNPVTP